ncbi:hypothetical protein PBRA_002839 [Plasmodiophora brassicae]|uniref:Uncharacterized protein n=1 Tax=Plasmodiophora brassicae TaxID=37360 RepID=A0A0G4J5R7_PLABS|nr:hypothetical protein PBRA_002839 [Plasmodiophora brassicae]
MSFKRSTEADILPPRVKRQRPVSAELPKAVPPPPRPPVQPSNVAPAAQHTSCLQRLPSSRAVLSGEEFVNRARQAKDASTASNVITEMLSGLRHEWDASPRLDLYIAIALLARTSPQSFQNPSTVVQLLQLLLDPQRTGLLRLGTALLLQLFPTLPFQVYQFYIETLLAEDDAKTWVDADSCSQLVVELNKVVSPPTPEIAPQHRRTDSDYEEEEMLEESGSVAKEVGLYLARRLTNILDRSSVLLLKRTVGLRHCRENALRMLESLSSFPNETNAAHEPIVELLQSLCDWCKSLADMTLFARILSLRIPVPGLSSMLSTGKWWQAALHFLVFQSEISPGSHPHTFSAVVLQFLEQDGRLRSKLGVLLCWAVTNPTLDEPYLRVPEFPIQLLTGLTTLSQVASGAAVSLSALIGHAAGPSHAAEYELLAATWVNGRVIKDLISSSQADASNVALSTLLIVLAMESPNDRDMTSAIPLALGLLEQILSMALISRRITALDAMLVMQCLARRSLRCGSSLEPSNPSLTRTIPEAIMQLCLAGEVTGEVALVSGDVYWNAVILLVLLSALYPPTIGKLAYQRLRSVRRLIDAVLTDKWDGLLIVEPASSPRSDFVRLRCDNIDADVRPPHWALSTVQQYCASYDLSEKIVHGDAQYVLAQAISKLQSPAELCGWFVRKCLTSDDRVSAVPALILARILLHMGVSAPPSIKASIAQACQDSDAIPKTFLSELSHDDSQRREAARTALDIAYPPHRFGFLREACARRDDGQAIRLAVAVETDVVALTHYLGFLIETFGAGDNGPDDLVSLIHEHVLRRYHVGCAVSNDVSGSQMIHRAFQAAFDSRKSRQAPMAPLLDATVQLLSYGGVSGPLLSDALSVLEEASSQGSFPSEAHVDLLLDGLSAPELQRLVLPAASMQQLQRYALSFGRDDDLLDLCQRRMRDIETQTSNSVAAMVEEPMEQIWEPAFPAAGTNNNETAREPARPIDSSASSVPSLSLARVEEAPRHVDLPAFGQTGVTFNRVPAEGIPTPEDCPPEHDLIRMWFEGGDKWDILISLVRRLGRAR